MTSLWVIGFRFVLILCLTIGFFAPIFLGFWQTLLPAFGYLPALGDTQINIVPWQDLFSMPGFGTSLRLTFVTGFASTALALTLAMSFCAIVHGRIGRSAAERMLAPFLATPHAAMAIGLAFLLTPSGLFFRLLSPWATGWQMPPDITIIHDAWGIMLILGLLTKEVPFLLLVILAALNQISVREYLAAGQALGYARGLVWVKIVFPQVYPQIRLSIYVVLAFALSVVDIAIILGPNNPPTLAVAAMTWFQAPDTALLKPAAAAAILQTLITVSAIAIWWVIERGFVRLGHWWIARGGRGLTSEPGLRFASSLVLVLFALATLALVSIVLWSVSWRWSFPALFPDVWSGRAWGYAVRTGYDVMSNTVGLGLVTTLTALVLAIAWLEGAGLGRDGSHATLLLSAFLPLFIPQIAFLFGLDVIFLQWGLSGTFVAVAWAQVLFVFPYIMMALADPWRALDPRYIRSAAALGSDPFRILMRIKLPLLLRPILTSAAIGFAVSVGLYLPTLIIGEGRVPTLTTEAVALASGADRRLQGVYAVLQAAMPMLAYASAFLIPRVVFARRAALRGDVI